MKKIKKLEFTKEHTCIAKSAAIIIMFIHHLFAFSNRGGAYISVLPILSGEKNIEYHLAVYGKICVAMYLFLSGYGISIIENRKKITFKDSIARIKKIYLNYLIVFFLFIPLGFYLKKLNLVNGFEIIKNLMGITNTYNDSWWFFRLYIILIFIFPLTKKLISDNLISSLIKIMLIYILPILASKYIRFFPNLIFLEKLYVYSLIYILTFWQASFFMGYIFCKFKFYEILKSFFITYKLDRKYIYIIGILMLIYIRTKLGKHGLLLDFLNAPLLIFFISNTFYDIKSIRVFKVLANHSTNMWLTHSFFCFSYFQELIFYPKYSILILLNLIFMTLITSKIIEKILKLIIDFKLEKLKNCKKLIEG